MRPAFAQQRGASAGGDARPGASDAPPKPLPNTAELYEIGADLLHQVFRLKGDSEPSKIEGAALDRGDLKWLHRRLKKLGPMADGPIRVIPKRVWNIATLCMHKQHGLEAIKRFAAGVPSHFLAIGAAVALWRYDSTMRPVDSRRAQSILTLVIVMWHLAKPNKGGGQFGYVIRGLPYGAFCALVAVFENFGKAERKTPHVNTVWGTHRPGGRYDRAELGYMASLRQAGAIRTKQPPWWVVEPGRRGKPHKNEQGELECWAFVEVFLRIPEPGVTFSALPLGLPPVERHFPSHARRTTTSEGVEAPKPASPMTAAQPAVEPGQGFIQRLLEQSRGERPAEPERPALALAPASAAKLPSQKPFKSLQDWLTKHPFWVDALGDDPKRGPPSTS